MARNKRSTALFEVIHTAKRPPRGSPSQAIPTPRWWQKDKKPIVAMPEPVRQTGETAGRQSSWLSAFRKPVEAASPDREDSHSTAEWDPTAQPIRRTPTTPTPDEAPAVFWVPDPVSTTSSFAGESDLTESSVAGTSAEQSPAVDAAIAADPTPEATAETNTEANEVDPPLVAEVKERFADRVKRGGATALGPTSRVASTVEPPVVQKSTTVRPARDRRDPTLPVAGEINLKFSYFGMMAVALILLVVVVMAYVAGTHRSESAVETKDWTVETSRDATLSAVAPSKPVGSPARTTEQVTAKGAGVSKSNTAGIVAKQAASDKSAIDKSATDKSTLDKSATDKSAIDKSRKSSDENLRPDVIDHPPTRVSPAIGTARVVGKRYFVIQSFLEMSEAQKVADAFNHAGIACSLVKLRDTGYAFDGWYSLVGLEEIAADDSGGKITEYNRRVNSLYSKVAPRSPKPVKQWVYSWQGNEQ